jgi:hypothetical protein
MERYLGEDPDIGDEDLFGDPDEVDFSIEDELDAGLQAEQELDED